METKAEPQEKPLIMMLTHIPVVEKVLYPLAMAFLSMPLIERIDLGIRISAAVLGILLTIYLIRRAHFATEAERLNIQIRRLELEKMSGKKSDPESPAEQ